MLRDEYYDLGGFGRPVTTTSDDAQTWFDRGLTWCYAFNHEEAVRCFQHAIEADPACAMAHWGLAYAIGPNYNKNWDAFEEQELTDAVATAHAAVTSACELAGAGTPVERALIGALRARFPEHTPAEDCAPWNDEYAAAMRTVYAEFGDDQDVASLFAEALIGRTPWLLWDLQTGEPAEGADTAEAIAVLERGMANPNGARPHPGLLHMYVHTMEMSPFPERALRAADQLRDLVPDAGHLVHMPTHIDVLCGNYRDVVTGNRRAIVADRKFLEREGALNFYTLYRCHDYHFTIYGAMFLGQPEPALEAAAELRATLTEELLRIEVPVMADWLEGFVPMRLHVLVRFGMWDEILAEPLPDDAQLYCVTTAMLHYAKGVALRGHRRPGRGRRAAPPVPRGLRARAGHPLPVQQHLPGRAGRGRPRCWTARSSTAAAATTPPSRTCAARSSSTTTCSTTSPGPGCSRPATRWARCCSSRATSRRRRPSTGPTWVWTRRSAGPASTPTTSGACTGSTSA